MRAEAPLRVPSSASRRRRPRKMPERRRSRTPGVAAAVVSKGKLLERVRAEPPRRERIRRLAPLEIFRLRAQNLGDGSGSARPDDVLREIQPTQVWTPSLNERVRQRAGALASDVVPGNVQILQGAALVVARSRRIRARRNRGCGSCAENEPPWHRFIDIVVVSIDYRPTSRKGLRERLRRLPPEVVSGQAELPDFRHRQRRRQSREACIADTSTGGKGEGRQVSHA